jgi:hypothetical protein
MDSDNLIMFTRIPRIYDPYPFSTPKQFTPKNHKQTNKRR